LRLSSRSLKDRHVTRISEAIPSKDVTKPAVSNNEVAAILFESQPSDPFLFGWREPIPAVGLYLSRGIEEKRPYVDFPIGEARRG
jgi:hypothetical protein